MLENSLVDNRLDTIIRLLKALGVSERWGREVKEYVVKLDRRDLSPTRYEVLIAATYLVLKKNGEIVSVKELIERLDRELGKRVSYRKVHKLLTRSQDEEAEYEDNEEILDPLERYLAIKTGIIQEEQTEDSTATDQPEPIE